MTAVAATLQATTQWQCGNRCLDIRRPLIMGIINATPDSFSDGGHYDTTEAGYRHGMTLLEEGADILDVGGESTRPGAMPVEEEEEKRRIMPLIEQLAKAGAVVSADTMKASVMRTALDSGAVIINDINGFRALGCLEVAAETNCGLVVMHMQGEPRTMQKTPHYQDVAAAVGDFFRARVAALTAAGVAPARVCLDPGIGFGKTVAHNVALLNQLRPLAAGFPLLVGISRKSIFTSLPERNGTAAAAATAAERDTVSAIAAALLLERGAHIVRVHNVALTVQAVQVWQLMSERVQ